MKLLKAPAPSSKKAAQEANGEESTSSGSNGRRPLCRPIICVCNDAYVPALRALHRDAVHVKMPPTSVTRVVQRMRHVCTQEGIKADTRSLSALAELCERDVRSCLNTLQFLRARGRPLDADALLDTSVGHRDITRSLARVLEDIFLLPKPTTRLAEQRQQQMHRPLTSLFASISSNGEADKIVQACFSNYLSAKYTDVTGGKVSATLDWIAFYDKMANHHDVVDLDEYLAAVPAAVHHLCAAAVKPYLDLTRVDSEVRASARLMCHCNTLL